MELHQSLRRQIKEGAALSARVPASVPVPSGKLTVAQPKLSLEVEVLSPEATAAFGVIKELSMFMEVPRALVRQEDRSRRTLV